MAHIQTQTEWEEDMSGKILEFVRHELYLELRYLAPALSALCYRRYEGLLTFATDGMFLYYAAEPLLRIFKKNAFFLDRVYLHTVFHCMFKHLWMKSGREGRLWNVACDVAAEFVIDSMDNKCTKRILSWLRKDTYEVLKSRGQGISAAIVYQWLRGLDEENVKALAVEFYTDDHRFWPKEEKQHDPAIVQAKQNWDKTARQVTLEQNRRGDDRDASGEYFRLQVQAAKNRRGYKEFLEKFTVLLEEPHLDPDEFDLGYYTYGLSFYGKLPLIEPLETREKKKIHEFVIVIDTSYSTSGDLVKGFLEETFSILSLREHFFERSFIRILQCDDRMQKDDEIRSERDLKRLLAEYEILGGGGTDFRPAFSYIEELRMRGELNKPDGLLYFTDGKGIYPEKRPDYRTAFLFLGEYDETAVPPWAMRLRLDPEDWMHEY